MNTTTIPTPINARGSGKDKSYKLLHRISVTQIYGNPKDRHVVRHVIDVNETPSKQGALIRDAITGYTTSFVVGTIAEDLFYSVLYTGQGHDGGPILAFYESPGEYEKHNFTRLPASVKTRWEMKANSARNLLSSRIHEAPHMAIANNSRVAIAVV